MPMLSLDKYNKYIKDENGWLIPEGSFDEWWFRNLCDEDKENIK